MEVEDLDKIRELVDIAYKALDEKKASDIRVIDITEVSTIADYFIITNGDNPVQVQAICDNVEEKLAIAGYKPKAIEGFRSAKWILLDYGDVIINVFSKDERLFYDLERIWQDGKVITI